MKTKIVEFQVPEGFVIPEGTEPGEEFDLVCSFRVRNNGTLCLTRLGETEMPGYKDKEDRQERPRYGMARAMMTGSGPEQETD